MKQDDKSKINKYEKRGINLQMNGKEKHERIIKLGQSLQRVSRGPLRFLKILLWDFQFVLTQNPIVHTEIYIIQRNKH